ncbi:hypothetical protein INQ41_07310 [Lysobacter ciconiae]|uniref:DUF2007 domain-containing protein n=1 Tax=Novilysobacter ciconiae TaxID=2781022 RepID=A0A7S6ZRA8_9GAMM|nr:DUF6164 family protein [Lysobacter ciconiae]QOW18530.1 hypothetical protein INQ41_07310 [Lysobacter ciconiae]
MSKLLLNLRLVLDDEIEDVRAMLDENRIEYYETKPSRWGISHGAIWLSNDGDLPEAKRLMAIYQGNRQARARAEYEAGQKDGTGETFADVWRREPLKVLLAAAAVIVLLGLVALPAILLRG